MNKQAPWLKYYHGVPLTIDYPDVSMSALVARAAEQYPDNAAYTFMGRTTNYTQMMQEIHACAKAFQAIGIRRGDRVTICMPNLPQTVVSFYALNQIGAIANMIHPLSSEGEIAFFLRESDSVAAVILDQFYDKFAPLLGTGRFRQMVVANVGDALGTIKKIGYRILQRKNSGSVVYSDRVLSWKKFLSGGGNASGGCEEPLRGKDPAAILYSGGTTGTTKGILLSNLNFNALALQTGAMAHCLIPGNSMLAVMPMFHGFGLGVCIHLMLTGGCRCILVPRFNAKSYAELLRTQKPNYIAGVPTLYEAILHNPDMEGVDLSCLFGVFSGGDSLSIELKKNFDRFLKEHNASVQIREGYGTTECVTASCLTPYDTSRVGSIGLPFPDTFYQIVEPGTTEEVPFGEEGEICISGPSVMMEYINQPKETADTLRIHADGKRWLHTGDLGVIDEDGFVYYKQRIKRMIISSGYSIYPSQLESIIDGCPLVQASCVIGVPDPYKMQKVKAFVILEKGILPTDAIREEILAYCRKNIAKYSMPYEIEFREEFPKTRVGKIAYTVLEAEEADRLRLKAE